MIQLQVTSVARRTSSAVATIHYSYEEGKDRGAERQQGAEWEEIEFEALQEEKPTIAIGNIAGNIYIGGYSKLILNNPILFGTFKVGDIINFMPIRLTEAETTKVDTTPPIPVPLLDPPTSHEPQKPNS